MYYFRYFIKCCIRNISRLICKPKVLLVLGLSFLLLFCFGKMEVNAAEKVDLNPEYLENRTITGTENKNSPQGQISEFGGFYIFFAPISYKGQKVGYNLQTSQTCEVRYGFAEYVTPGTSAYFYNQETTSQIGNLSTHNNIESPISKGFFIVCVYQGYAVTNLDMYTMDTVADDIALSTAEIIENNDNNTQLILDAQEEMMQQITDGQQEINNTLTSTDYDESVVNIDTSDATNVDDSSSVQLFTTIFTNFSNLLNDTSWSQVETIEIGLPYTDGVITLRSDILSNIFAGSFLYTFITIAWYSLFGLYCFRFTTKIYQSIKSGDILNGLNLSDEAITSTML